MFWLHDEFVQTAKESRIEKSFTNHSSLQINEQNTLMKMLVTIVWQIKS